MELRSIDSPVREQGRGDSIEAGAATQKQFQAVLENRITPAAANPPPLSDLVRRRLVTGKSARPLFRPESSGLESVLDADERTRIVNTSESPWRMVCALSIDSEWGTYVGTGWFVAPTTLITAGHCVFDRNQMNGWARRIAVTPARDRELTPFGSAVSTRFSTVDRWLSDQDPDFDIAAIHLDEPMLTDPSAVFRVGALTDEELVDYMINVSGYPGTPGGGQELYWAKNRIRAVTPRRIFYDVDTSGGQSGGPAYIFREGEIQPIVVGIHAYGLGGTPASMNMRVNSAPRIIPAVVDQIEHWCQNGGAGGIANLGGMAGVGGGVG
ncbi:trypsin-like peptidase domain-containing protein [Alsobacter sp. KACC 23698]|uniref:Serine protease n=1 Tax=Alsobacter sp. KACC 23698 TaxID=3149229 RepID=A0AAU7JC29_9HYPH